MNVPVSTVRSVIKKFTAHGTVANLPRCGRKRKIDKRFQRKIVRTLDKEPRLTSKQVQAALQSESTSVNPYYPSPLLLDGPYDETFFERLKDLSLEDDGSVEYAVTKIQQYRVAMTAKDCSIMIALSPTVQEECHAPAQAYFVCPIEGAGATAYTRRGRHRKKMRGPGSGRDAHCTGTAPGFDSRPLIKASRSSFMYSVSILDLDLKPYENIPHQYKRDSKIVNHYLSLQSREEPSTSLIFPEREDCTLLLHQV
ncbi:unnamed protein product [Ranitomeya imitator]|uniref:Inositol-pentakisphosphate 2-kinase n=1 Tax=Ranitomeya imitator TaxID=111125 RepID=A0ABN9KQX7_9NEOB|nr:unnamed protein product [Ranitomeya imitator]